MNDGTTERLGHAHCDDAVRLIFKVRGRIVGINAVYDSGVGLRYSHTVRTREDLMAVPVRDDLMGFYVACPSEGLVRLFCVPAGQVQVAALHG